MSLLKTEDLLLTSLYQIPTTDAQPPPVPSGPFSGGLVSLRGRRRRSDYYYRKAHFFVCVKALPASLLPLRRCVCPRQQLDVGSTCGGGLPSGAHRRRVDVLGWLLLVYAVHKKKNSFFKADHTIDLIFYNVVAIRENKTRRAESSIHSSPVAL